MIRVLPDNKQKCCGCSACEQACAERCITMVRDEEGFVYPQIDGDQCVGCGLCERVCPIISKQNLLTDVFAIPKAVGGWHRKQEIRAQSSSGGAFTLLAEYILKQGGVVYGCRLNEKLEAEHIGVSSVEELGQLRGSKYIQSEIKGVYQEIKIHLKHGRMVLFTGTPCQAAGLNGFLGKKYDCLYICDFICHGVPSLRVFKSYISFLEEKYQDKAIDFRFRNKDKGWNQAGVQMGSGTALEFLHIGRKRFYPGFRDAFMNGFLDNLYLRPSCYYCEFKSLPKYYSDLTIADFWGVKRVKPQLNDGKGTSLVLINNKHGEELFDLVKDDFFYQKCEFSDAVSRNKSLTEAALWNSSRERFFMEYSKKPFLSVKRKYMSAYRWGKHKAGEQSWSFFQKTVQYILNPVFNFLRIEWSKQQWRDFFQFVKFSMVGVSNVIVSYLINVLALVLLQKIDWEWDYVAANLVSFVLSVLWSFHWNNKFVFKMRKGEKRSKWKTLFRTYVSYGLTGIVMNNVFATIWIHGLRISKYLAPLLNLPMSVPVNFLITKKWTYGVRKEKV